MKRIKKVVLLGDLKTETGPGVANRSIYKSLSFNYNVKYSNATSKIRRVFEIVRGIVWADCLMICSKSNLNYLSILLAKLLGRKIIYVVHGLTSMKILLEKPDIEKGCLKKYRAYEKFFMKNADRVVFVSEYAMKTACRYYPEFRNKFNYIYNVVDIEKDVIVSSSNKNRQRNIISVGGGVKIKNNLSVCKAIKELDDSIPFFIVGKEAEDGIKIKDYENVKWIGTIDHEKLLNIMRESEIYIQNSLFETFGLAVIEALYSGCNILISNSIGCKDVFSNLTENDIIYDVNNIKEIKNKIDWLLIHGNNQRLLEGLEKEKLSLPGQAKRLRAIIEEVI